LGSDGLSVLAQQTFAPRFGHLLDDAKYIDHDYVKALAAFAVWRTVDYLLARDVPLFFSRITLWQPYAIVHLPLPTIQHSRG
jgi:hypothetical protein